MKLGGCERASSFRERVPLHLTGHATRQQPALLWAQIGPVCSVLGRQACRDLGVTTASLPVRSKRYPGMTVLVLPSISILFETFAIIMCTNHTLLVCLAAQERSGHLGRACLVTYLPPHDLTSSAGVLDNLHARSFRFDGSLMMIDTLAIIRQITSRARRCAFSRFVGDVANRTRDCPLNQL